MARKCPDCGSKDTYDTHLGLDKCRRCGYSWGPAKNRKQWMKDRTKGFF